MLAIANLTSLAYGLDVSVQKYASSKVLRNHLMYCLEEKKFLPFPMLIDDQKVPSRFTKSNCSAHVDIQRLMSTFSVLTVKNCITLFVSQLRLAYLLYRKHLLFFNLDFFYYSVHIYRVTATNLW